MDNQDAFELADALLTLKASVDRHNELQDEANQLMRSLIPALEATAQELLDLREHLTKSGD